jgi:hypothetical protein
VCSVSGDNAEVREWLVGGAIIETPDGVLLVRNQRRAVADRAQSVDRQQHLVLTAAPGPRRINVDREHLSAMHHHEVSKTRRS